MTRAINRSRATTFAGMSNAIRSGDHIYIAGQVALDENAQLVGPGDARAQAEQCFRNIEALAELAGGDRRDIVRLTCYLADIEAYPAYAAVKAELFDEHPPAATAVVVSALLDPAFLLEIEATLVLPASGPTQKESAR